ncbi:MAG TPA: U32 family peptidase C-terminal domain-containing protein [Leptospiraceae bacterium]|nr:U32 family peptidase C-terminal domain-containing protein [Leptospiraceae bacterium]HMW07252.1 U32 family peptidase C-terminal domain-containing protein [Leptospiraceae bacterium]HMX34206.1 U32 family peptidase C-terminal domain-containing protein [Leptospiraceae bacterium]HMY32929.1 U32 family peptidase C-terminal domain-containing protein [Leptospiraceae bacterium]HMZ66058.1 U32 family peptidase C-terminal domain-containing protein [Leptospiraceae bacterium]
MPAGNLEKMKLAYEYGADAIYCGVPRYSLRARENDFTMEDLKSAVLYAHSRNKKIYFTINAFPRNSKLPSYPKYLQQMAELKPDGFIMADPGLIFLTRKLAPEINIHISVQANTMNYASVEFWKSVGATRVILSREVSISEVKEIREKVPDMELEVFVHGAVCIAHSGRCLMSNYFTQRDANQGACNNACRDKYKVFVTNTRQNDEPMEIIESDEGTFLMNSKDMRAIQYLKEIRDAGVDSIKVEGRTKNEYYVALVARSYRKALDDLKDGKEFDERLLDELNKVASRKYFSGFLTRGMEERVPVEEQNFQNYEIGYSYEQSQMYAGTIQKVLDDSLASFQIKNKIALGEKMEVFFPRNFESKIFSIEEMYFKGEKKEVLSGGMGEVQIKIPFPVEEHCILSVIRKSERKKDESNQKVTISIP